MTEILVGYEVLNPADPRRAGREVSVPLKHTAVLGQTQESGKTTTQEAMISRSGLRAVAFLTKRGEQSFRLSQPIKPFFREAQDDYFRYVIAVIEGMLEMKLGSFERQLILKLCRDYEKAAGTGKKRQVRYAWRAATSLEQLAANVKKALPHLRGRDEGTAMQLEEYLKSVIPEIEASDFDERLRIRPGINVMDVTRLSMGLQSLVIASVIDWVHQREKNTIVIIPEAWKFIPEGRSSAVKRSAERLIREGAALKNFVWIDSQDLRGIDKTIVRSVTVWLFGVQREKNEVLNTLNSLPALPKPSATDIMGLKKGQFFVTYGDRLVKTYVRPAGMEAEQARAIARGEESADSWKSIVRTLDSVDETKSLDEREADEEDATQQGGEPAGADAAEGEAGSTVGGDQRRDHPGDAQSGGGTRDAVEDESFGSGADTDPPGERGDNGGIGGGSGDDEMWKEKYEQLNIEFEQLREAHDKMAKRLEGFLSSGVPPLNPAHPAPGEEQSGGTNGAGISTTAPAAVDFKHGGVPSYNSIYLYVRDRALAERPALLQLLLERPELEVAIQKRTIQTGDDTPPGRVAILIRDKFFDAPVPLETVSKEFKRRGWLRLKGSSSEIAPSIEEVLKWGFLTREANGYCAVPGMKVNVLQAGK